MVYPATRQTFPNQNPDTVADNNLINDITNLLVSLQDYVGYTNDSPASSTHEGRLKKLEGSGVSRLVFGPTPPTGTPIINDLWINTSLSPWVEYYYNGTAWVILGANGVMLAGKMLDTTITPLDSQVPVYRSSVDRIQWQTVLANPFSNPGEMVLGGSGGTPTVLPPGLDNEVLSIDPATHVPHWAPTPHDFEQLHLLQYMDFVLTTTPGVSNIGELRLYASSSPLGLYYSANGGSYQAIGSGSGGSDLSSLLNTQGAMVYASDALGTLAKLSLGAEGAVLASIGGFPTWLVGGFIASPAAAVVGSVLYYDGSIWLQLPPGTAGQFLRTQGAFNPPAWTDLPSSPPGSGIASPVGSTTGDVLVHNGTDWVRLPAGALGLYLQTQGTSGPPQWVALPPTLSNPMTTPGDTMYATVGGTPVRLAGGVANNERFMSIVAGIPAWVDSPASLGKSMWMSG